MIHIWTAVVDESGFVARLVEHRTDIVEVKGSNPVNYIEALIFSGFLPIDPSPKWRPKIQIH